MSHKVGVSMQVHEHEPLLRMFFIDIFVEIVEHAKKTRDSGADEAADMFTDMFEWNCWSRRRLDGSHASRNVWLHTTAGSGSYSQLSIRFKRMMYSLPSVSISGIEPASPSFLGIILHPLLSFICRSPMQRVCVLAFASRYGGRGSGGYNRRDAATLAV